MAKDPKIDRARRSLLKAVGVIAAAVAATALHRRSATAQGNSGGHGDGDGHGQGHKSCFLRGTRIRTADGYRPIETLSVGDRVIARFAGLVPIKAISASTLQ